MKVFVMAAVAGGALALLPSVRSLESRSHPLPPDVALISGVAAPESLPAARPPAPRKAVAAPASVAAAVDADGHAAAPAGQASLASVQQVVTQRCASCHSATPTQAGFASAPGGVMLDTEAQLKQHAAKIFQRAVQNKDMPLANMTHMTDAERQLIGTWFETSAN